MTKRPNTWLIVALVVFTGLVQAVYQADVLDRPLAPMSRMTAQLVVSFLHWSGHDAIRSGTLVSHPNGFAYEINYRCTGCLPASFLIVAILFYSAPLRKKAVGLAVGVPCVLFFNLVRLVHLFHLGVDGSAFFPAAHSTVWPAATIMAVFGLWYFWTGWSRNEYVSNLASRQVKGV